LRSIFSSDVLQGKTVVVTGATGGIGQSIAHQLAQMGANLLLTGRNEEKLAHLKQSIQAKSGQGRIETIPADLTDAEDRDRLVKETRKALGSIDILINNAGVFAGALLEEVEKAELERVMNVNFTSVVMLTQQVYEEMRRRQSGKIINISSLSGLRGWEGGTIYASSKFALNGFTQCLAVEAAKYGIQVNAVAPGFVETEMAKEAIGVKARRAGQSLEEMWTQMEKGIPSGRLSRPEEVAAVTAFLCTDAANNIIGAHMRISGGGLLG
jgi:3-oxoacyl-[acyl-carrier protein] reductase